jgi:ABC-type multidrug transport system fused ATPase/permease subunit
MLRLDSRSSNRVRRTKASLGKRCCGIMPTVTTEPRRPHRRAMWRETLELLATHRGRLSVALTLILVGRAAALVLPTASKILIDDVIWNRQRELLPLLALVVIAATLVQGLAAFAVSHVMGIAAHIAIADMRKRVEQHVVRMPVSWFAATRTGVLITRIMNDPEGIRNVIGTGMVQLAGGLVTGALGLIVLLYLNWTLTLMVLAALGLVGAALTVSFRKVQPLHRERVRIAGQITGRLGETLAGIRVVKAYTSEKREDLVFARGLHSHLRVVARTITAASSGNAFTTVVIGILGVIVMLVGERAIAAGTMTLGGLVMYVFVTGLVVAPMITVAALGSQLSEAFAGLHRIRELLQEPGELLSDTTKAVVQRVRGDLAFEGVSFEYVAGVPVLRDVSLVAPAGTTTALVGPSGAGKSTLIDLIMAFITPTSGRLLVDGRDVAEFRLRDYRAQLGIVLQDNFLFDGTIADNLLYARPYASREEMEEAARVAHVHDFVESLDHGYETLVGERGVKLSGGQRQRIAIARAIIARPSILVLDEATSSLDSESEAKIQEALSAVSGGRTTFVIAHRLSTIRKADQILMMEAGRIVERGTHEQLLARGGRYRRLHDQQIRAAADPLNYAAETFDVGAKA